MSHLPPIRSRTRSVVRGEEPGQLGHLSWTKTDYSIRARLGTDPWRVILLWSFAALVRRSLLVLRSALPP
jgi:hypothetical protein